MAVASQEPSQGCRPRPSSSLGGHHPHNNAPWGSRSHQDTSRCGNGYKWLSCAGNGQIASIKEEWAKNLGARSTNFASAPTEFFPPVVFRSETTMQAHTLDFARLVIVNTEIEKVIYTGSVRLYMAHWKLEAK